MLMPRMGFGRLRRWAQKSMVQDGDAVYESFGRMLMAYAGGAWDGKPCVYAADLQHHDYQNLMPQFTALADQNGLKINHIAKPWPDDRSIIHVTFTITNNTDLIKAAAAESLRDFTSPKQVGEDVAREVLLFMKKVLYWRKYGFNVDWMQEQYIKTDLEYTKVPGLMQAAMAWVEELNAAAMIKSNMTGIDPDEFMARPDKTTGKPTFYTEDEKATLRTLIEQNNAKLKAKYPDNVIVKVILDGAAPYLSAIVSRPDTERNRDFYVKNSAWTMLDTNDSLVDETVKRLLAVDGGNAQKAFRRAQSIFKSHVNQRNNNVAVNWNAVVLKLYQLATNTPTFDEQNKVKASHRKSACGFCQVELSTRHHFCSSACERHFYAGQVPL